MKDKFTFFNELDQKEPRFDWIETWTDGKNKFFIAKNAKEDLMIYENGEKKALPQICQGLLFDNGGVAQFEVDGKYGLIDFFGNIVIEPKYEFVSRPDEELIRVGVNKKVGYVDMNGNEVIPPRFSQATGFSEGLAAVEIGGKFGYIDKTGKFVIKPKYTYASIFFGGLAEVRKGKRITYIDKNGKKSNRKQPKEILPFSDGRKRFCIDEKYGFINEENDVVIPAQYENAKNFHNGLTGVKREGEIWGFIDTDGNTVIEPRFDDVTYFSEGLCAVRIDENWGYIDIMGDVVIKPRFEEAGSFSNGCAEAGENYKVGIIDKKGNYLIKPTFDIIRPFGYEGCRIVKIGDKYDIIKVLQND